jgi:hypothetical protein
MLIPYYVLALGGLALLGLLSAVVGLFFNPHPLLGLLFMPVAIFLIDWLPARYTPVETDT